MTTARRETLVPKSHSARASALRSRWQLGEITFGAWFTLPTPLVVEAVANAGFDHICLDDQHGSLEPRDLDRMLGAVELGPAVGLIRVAQNNPATIGRALDRGALGVIIPMVNTADDAQRAVSACRYAPLGTRSYGLTRAGVGFTDYYNSANDNVLCIPMIETHQAVENIDEILVVPGIDAVYVGPSDLSITYGLPPQQDNPDPSFQHALRSVVGACRRHGVTPGIHANPSLARQRVAQGFQMVTVGLDALALIGALVDALQTSRQASNADA